MAHYVTRSIAKSGSGYTALGVLTLRGVTKEVPINFQFVPSNGSAKLVADAVRISFALVLNAKQ